MPREDHRKDANGDPIRRSIDVSFLNLKSGDMSQYLCQAQISCTISGVDEWRWVAYCFVDTYFDGEDEARESLLEYHDNAESEYGMNADPLTYGNVDADHPIWDPRAYFLTVLRYRTLQVRREWERVVTNIEKSFRVYQKVRRSSVAKG